MRPETERQNPRTARIADLGARAAIELIDAEEPRTLEAVAAVADQLAEAAERVADATVVGSRIVFLGAGTSGRVVAGEASEMRPTFGVDPKQFSAYVAGAGLRASITNSEDDDQAVPEKLAELALGPEDVVIGVAASGTTRFVTAGIEAAKARRSWTCGIANNPGTPLLELADLGICLRTGPEVVTGSTRMQAATAQKLALNRITTAAMIVAGRVVANQMVDMQVSVSKLRRRAVWIVADLADVAEEEAERRLEQADWQIRRAIDG